jgi:hypothetical protein
MGSSDERHGNAEMKNRALIAGVAGALLVSLGALFFFSTRPQDRAVSMRDRKDRHMSPPDDASTWDVHFTCSLDRLPNRLEVRYRLDNTGREDVIVMDQISKAGVDGMMRYSPDHVYVDLDEGTLQLTKGALTSPSAEAREHGASSYRHHPEGRIITPGASVEVTFTVPIPVKVRNPFRRPQGPGQAIAAKKRTARAVVVSVGVVPWSCTFTALREHPAYPDLISVMNIGVDPANGLPCQTLRSKRFELDDDLPVLDYEIFGRP